MTEYGQVAVERENSAFVCLKALQIAGGLRCASLRDGIFADPDARALAGIFRGAYDQRRCQTGCVESEPRGEISGGRILNSAGVRRDNDVALYEIYDAIAVCVLQHPTSGEGVGKMRRSFGARIGEPGKPARGSSKKRGEAMAAQKMRTHGKGYRNLGN